MIEAEADFDALARRLASKAAALAAARATSRRLAARNADSRWRHAGLVWPLFAKG